MYNSFIPKLIDFSRHPIIPASTYTYSKPVKKEPTPVEVLGRRDDVNTAICEWLGEYSPTFKVGDLVEDIHELVDALIRRGLISFD